MRHTVNRRQFIAAASFAAAGWGMGIPGSAAQAPVEAAAPVFKTKLLKALIARPTEDDLRRLKDSGFDGLEARSSVTPEEAGKLRNTAEQLGLRIHSVLIDGWAEFNSPDPSVVERSLSLTQAALKTAAAFGADTVLLVPGRIAAGGRATSQGAALRMPRPWEFQIDFDAKNGHLNRVAYGDNSVYADYIKAHDHATDSSREAIQRLIPFAEKARVVMAVENVGNNLWVQPTIFRHFVESFQSRWVRAYFDIANNVRFAPPEQWILTLNTLLAKIHVKDYLLDPADPDGRGKGVDLREGSVRWPVVRQAIEAVDYSGWMTIESNAGLSFEERNRRLELIIAGR